MKEIAEKTKPTVIVFSTAYHPLIGGAEIAIEETIARLKDRFDFTIVTHRIRRDLPRYQEYRGGHIIRCGFGTFLDRIILFPFLACFQGLRITRGRKRLIMWGVMVSYASMGAFLIKLIRPRTPLILTIQEGDSEAHLTYGKLGLTGACWRMLLCVADEATAISTYLAGFVRRRGFMGPMTVVHNGVDIEKFKNLSPGGHSRGEFVVVTTSRLVHKNAVDVLIRAIAEVKKEAPEIRCRIIGDGEERKKLEGLVRGLGLEQEVEFFGSVAFRDIPRHLHDADIFVRPSRSEGMGNSFVEAIAAGLPIIGTPIGGITDIIEDRKTGLFAAPDDPADLAKKIMLLMRDENLRHSLIRAGLEMVRRRFSWDSIAEQYAGIFEKRAAERLRIAIATPLLPPDLGGVGHYALNLAERFFAAGWDVSTVSYAAKPRDIHVSGAPVRFVSLRWPTGLRHLLFFCVMLRRAWRSDIVLVLDQFSAGLPAMLACAFARVPYVTRMEGDFLWESYVERTRRDVTLASFWMVRPEMSLKERIIRASIRRVLLSARRIAYSSQWRRHMVETGLPALRENGVIIRNVWQRAGSVPQEKIPRERVILWAGRMIFLKNLERLIRAFERANVPGYELHLIGEGPEYGRLTRSIRESGSSQIRLLPALPHAELLRRIGEVAGVALPSLSEVGPNIIGDAVASRTPFLMTRESGYEEFFGDCGVLVDPLSEDDIARSLQMLMDEKNQASYRMRMERVAERRWQEAGDEWIKICTEAVQKKQA